MNQEEMSPQQQIRAAEHLPADLMLVKMEGEYIMTMAAARRVSLPTIIKEAKELLEANPAAAAQAVYSKPVGLKPDRCRSCGHEKQRKSWERFNSRCEKCGGKNNNMVEGKMVYARGLSIRAMESLSNLVCYNRLHADVTDLGGGMWKITAVFVDYARGIIRSDSDVVSQMYRQRGGGLAKMDDARFTDTTLKAAKAKTKRNVVKDALPFELREAYETKAMEVAPKVLTPEKIQEIIDAFVQQGVFLGDLQNLLQKDKQHWGKAEAETLRGVWQALENGEMTIDELVAECRKPGGEESGEQEPPQPGATDRKGKKPAVTAANVAAELTGQPPAGDPAGEDPGDQPPLVNESAPPSETSTPPSGRVSKGQKNTAASQFAQNRSESPSDTTLKQKSDPTNSTGRARSNQAGPVGAAGSTPAQPFVASSPGGPQGSNSPATGGQVARKPMSPDAAKQYMESRYAEECQEFDLDKVASVASGQSNPIQFIDLIITRKNPNWPKFVLPTASGGGESAGGPQGDPEESPSAGDEGEGELSDVPDFIGNPLGRPELTEVGSQAEASILGYKQAKRIEDFLAKEVEPNETLENEEVAYLLDLGKRRAWYLKKGESPPPEPFQTADE